MAYEEEFLKRALRGRIQNLSRAWGLDLLDRRPTYPVSDVTARDHLTGQFRAAPRTVLDSSLANLTT